MIGLDVHTTMARESQAAQIDLRIKEKNSVAVL
jgi:hypothetical protein